MRMKKIAATMFAAIAVIGATTASSVAMPRPPSNVMYEYIGYSDASHTEQVGYEYDTCTFNGVSGGRTEGHATAYSEVNAFWQLQRRLYDVFLIPARGRPPEAARAKGV